MGICCQSNGSLSPKFCQFSLCEELRKYKKKEKKIQKIVKVKTILVIHFVLYILLIFLKLLLQERSETAGKTSMNVLREKKKRKK